jgi:hypothetical protein
VGAYASEQEAIDGAREADEHAWVAERDGEAGTRVRVELTPTPSAAPTKRQLRASREPRRRRQPKAEGAES